MKKLAYIIGGLALGALISAAPFVMAQVQNNYFKLIGGVIIPNISTWQFELPYLANQNCIGTNGSGLLQAGTCSGGGSTFPFTSVAGYNSTSTTLAFLNGFFSTASSTQSGPFYLPALSQGFAYLGSAGQVNSIASSSVKLSWFNNDSGFLTGVTADSPLSGAGTSASHLVLSTAGTWSGNAGTASAFASTPTKCSAGNYTLGIDVNGNAQGCTAAGAGTITAVNPGTGLTGGGSSGSVTLTNQFATSSVPTLGQLTYWTGVGTPSTFGSVGTSTLTASSPLTGSFTQIGLGGSLGCQTASGSQAGCVAAADFSKFNSATTTFSTGLTYTLGTNAVTVNTSQNIATLSNLTTNGVIYTTGSNGTLNIGATTTLGSGYATTTTGKVAFSTTTAAFDGVTFGQTIVPSAGALTFTPTFSGNFNSLSHDTSLTGTTYNLSGAVSDWGLALGHTNTWSILQNFNYSSTSLYASFLNASSTNYFGAGLATCNGASNALTWSAGFFGCNSITATGGTGLSTTTADYIIYQSGSGVGVTNALYTPTNTVISSNASADVVLRATIAHATSTIGNKGADIYVKPGTYYLNATTTLYGQGIDSDANTFKIHGAGQDLTRFVVTGNADGFSLQNRVRVDFRNFSMFITGNANAITAISGASASQSVWNSSFDSLYINSTSTSVAGRGFSLTNDYRNTFTNIQFYGIANCIRAATEGNGLQTGDSTFSNIMCSTINNTLSGTIAFDFDGTANSNANQVNDDFFIDVNAFANLGSKTAWRFKHSNWMNVESSNPEGFATTTEIYNSSLTNSIHIEYAIGSTTASTYFYADSSSAGNNVNCQYIDSYSGSHKLFTDLNTDAKNPNILQGLNGSNCLLRGSGTFTYSTSTASIVRDIESNGATYLEQLKALGDRLVLNFATGADQFIKSVGSLLEFNNNGHTAITIDSGGLVGINNTAPGAQLDVNGASVFGNNGWVTQNTGGIWLDSYNSFNVGFYRNAVGDAFIRTNGTPNFTMLNGGQVGIATTTPQWPLSSFSLTQPQFSLSSGAGLLQWTMRNAGGNLYFSTTTVAGTATTSTSVFSITNNSNNTATSTFSFTDLLLKTTSANALSVLDGFGTQVLNLNTASTTGSIFTVAATTSPSILLPIKLFDVDQYGHITASSTRATPTIACSPSGGTIAANSNDVTGDFTTGTLSTSCTVTFGSVYSATPEVLITGGSTASVLAVTSRSTTAFTVGLGTSATGDDISYLVIMP